MNTNSLPVSIVSSQFIIAERISHINRYFYRRIIVHCLKPWRQDSLRWLRNWFNMARNLNVRERFWYMQVKCRSNALCTHSKGTYITISALRGRRHVICLSSNIVNMIYLVERWSNASSSSLSDEWCRYGSCPHQCRSMCKCRRSSMTNLIVTSVVFF
jgi:hypothetical protein